MLHCCREVKCHLGDTLEIYYENKIVVGHDMYLHICSLMVSATKLYYVSFSSFPGRTEY